MVTLIKANGESVINRRLEGGFTIKTKCLCEDDDFLRLKTSDELRRFMDFMQINKVEFGHIDYEGKFHKGKIHISVPKGDLGGSYCLEGNDKTVYITMEQLKRERKLRPGIMKYICLKCFNKAKPKEPKADRAYIYSKLTPRQLQANKAYNLIPEEFKKKKK